MGNVCKNTLKISGPFDSVLKLKNVAILEEVQNENDQLIITFALDALYPCPLTDLEDHDGWRKENWGTSVVYPDRPIIEDSGNEISLKYYSAGVPPFNAIEKISQDYPDLLFELNHWGLGSGFSGTCNYMNGEMFNCKIFVDDEYDAIFNDGKDIINNMSIFSCNVIEEDIVNVDDDFTKRLLTA